MASFEDLQFDWSMLCQDCTECWTPSDLQLAAELGKTLLERNKELETNLKQHQNVIEDQTQEIEYLTKQTVALREVNDSRLRIYEQLEVSIQDLERANHRLAIENAADKKHMKTLTANIETLDIKCEELQGTIDDLTLQLESCKRRILKTSEPTVITKTINLRHVGYDETDFQYATPELSQTKTENVCDNVRKSVDDNNALHVQDKNKINSENKNEVLDTEDSNEEISQLLSQLRVTTTLYSREQRKVTDLEEQLARIVQQNQALEDQLVQMHIKDEEGKSMHEELTTLEEVRQGQLCSRCLRTIDSPRTGDNMSCLGDEAEDDDSSMLEALMNHSQHRSSFTMDIQDDSGKPSPLRQESNLYRDLVEKYEALLEVQRNKASRSQKTNSLSLQEEMQMSGNFNNLSTKDTDEESGHGDSLQPEKQAKKERKSFLQTPTDFSEAETNSSGFSDEISNKATQTEGRPGSFLCTIADGEDCKFSIYDDGSPVIDSRFRTRPEYHELFSEIYTVLKKAAENKDKGDDLPLLDDHNTPIKSIPQVPPVTPATEECPDFPDNATDDTQSIVSSVMSELSTSQMDPPTIIEDKENCIAVEVKEKKEEPILTPLVRQPLEYLSVGVNVRKRSSSRRKKHLAERSDSPQTPILGSPKITYSSRPNSARKRKELKGSIVENSTNVWNGTTLHFYSRQTPSPTQNLNNLKNSHYENNLDYKPSTASQDLFKLKRLDLSYAEVLRKADNKKTRKGSCC